MSRKTARKHIFNLVFQTEFHTDIVPEVSLNTYIEEYGTDHLDEKGEPEKITTGDRKFILSEYSGIINNIDSIDEIIGSVSRWSIDRLSKMDLAILRIGVYEIKFADDIPAGVAVNEAVELAKQFGEDKAPSFINGVLASVIKKEA